MRKKMLASWLAAHLNPFAQKDFLCQQMINNKTSHLTADPSKRLWGFACIIGYISNINIADYPSCAKNAFY